MTARSETVAVETAKANVETELPDQPLVRIDSQRTFTLGLRDLYEYRDLLYFLTWRDIKVRYKQTALGVLWALIQPVLAMILFTIVFGRFAGVPSNGIPYPLFAYAGLLPWTFFSNAVTNSSNSLVGNANLVSKVYFPRLIIPGAAVLAGLVDFAIAFLLLAGMMVWYRVGVSVALLALPALVILTTLLALGIGMLLSALNVTYRDVRYAVPFLIQLWLFATPVIYPSNMVPAKWRWVVALNPMSGVIEGYRGCLFGTAIDWTILGSSLLFTPVLLFLACYFFVRMEESFADVI